MTTKKSTLRPFGLEFLDAVRELECYELSSKAQFTRANRFLFKRRLVYPARFDLHILLWDYNDRGQKGPIINDTCRLATAFKARLTAAVGASCTLGRVLCLKEPPGTFAGALDLVWSA